ncbi:MAG: acetyl-CoA carboxylase, biotin carboxyl carrier protein [Bacteroidota bacterium]|jgi:acetyl-CoA carboxylase biotin carboxyl carrier protein
MTFKEIQELIAIINKSNLAEFKLEQGDLKMVIRTSKYVKGKTQVIHSQPMMQMAAPSAPSAPAQSAESAPIAAAPAKSKSETPAESAVAKNLLEIKSPIVGTFYRAASVDKPPYIKLGDPVQKGTVVCIVEAMKLFNEIESEIKGKIVKICVNDASPVEYDQVLFLVDPNG